jgi:hypothetical protein
LLGKKVTLDLCHHNKSGRTCISIVRDAISASIYHRFSKLDHHSTGNAMAEASGVTETGLKEKITQELQALHVEIQDMSGISSLHLQLFSKS